MNITEEKKTLRKIIKERIFALENREELSRIICQKIIDFVVENNARKIALYYPLNDEVDTRFALRYLFARGVEIYLPIIKDGMMSFVLFDGEENLKNGTFGIQVPDSGILNADFDIIFVPLRAFDNNNGRLGRGGGYYDRVLPSLNAKKVGVAYSCQYVDSIPMDIYDFSLDFVIFA